MTAPVKLPRALRLDASDRFVFQHAAMPDEWCVVGTFAFRDADPASLDGKQLAAFRGGFLGVASCGWTTLVAVGEADEDAVAQATEALAGTLLARFGCPDAALARAAAGEEIAFAGEICAPHPPNTVIALARTVEHGAIRERFRTLVPRADRGMGAPFRIVEAEEGPSDAPDLLAMARRAP
jgi:hypothetical protein